MKKVLVIFLLISIISCSSDDNEVEEVCMETNVTMTIDGEIQNFQAVGRGISLRSNGYELSINLDRRSNNPFREQGVAIILPYKKTGENIIEKFIYHQYIENIAFDGDFIDGTLYSSVITNTNKCIHITFHGSLVVDNQEVIIENGDLSYKYEDPFD